MNNTSNQVNRSLLNVDPKLITPIYVKAAEGDLWPDDKVFYMLACGGLFRCRNQEFFSSCVPARRGPSALAEQEVFLDISYPRLPRRLLEIAVGFFCIANRLYGAEVTMLLLWDRCKQRYRLAVPHQRSIVSQNWCGSITPIGVHYQEPTNLPEDHQIIGDIHSHCEGRAFSSYTDRIDETYRTGLHIVVGCLDREPPEFHVEAVVDGVRFSVKTEAVLEGYDHRREFARLEWLSNVTVEFASNQDHSGPNNQKTGGSAYTNNPPEAH